jgi:hypothetical protein
MQRLLHGALAFTLVAVATCGAVHAGMPMEELPSSNCPYHEQQNAPQESGQCDSCLTPHFVGKSKVVLELGSIAIPALAMEVITLKYSSIARLMIPLMPPLDVVYPMPRPIRI